jgi:hypothetical protein
MNGLSNTYFYLVLSIILASVVYLIVQVKFPSLTEGFSEKHHKHGSAKHGSAKHGHHKITPEHHAELNKALAQVQTQKSQEAPTPQPQMHLINKRELILKDKTVNYDTNPTNVLLNDLAYGPFSYAALESMVPPQNSKLLYRIYAIYSDTMTSGKNEITFKFGWSGADGNFSVDLPLTWGAVGYQRDAYSQFFTADQIKAAGVKDPHEHAIVTANTTTPGTTGGLHKLYVETWLVY